MQKSHLFIRADADVSIGMGHVMRCLALAQSWVKRGGRAVFLSHCESEALQKHITAEGFDFIFLDKPHPDPFDIDFTISALSKIKTQNATHKDWLAVDGYHFDANYQKSIKEAGYKLLWIDDYGHADHYWADLILNQNISKDQSLYINREPYTQLLLGARYSLLRREFKHWQGWHREIPPIARKVLVTLGGGNPDNVTLKVIKAIKEINAPGLEARVISGPVDPHLETLKMEIGNDETFQLLTNVTNMPELMAWADVAIAAGGSTMWELVFMGLPSLIMILADNQCAGAESLHDHGIAINIGWYKDVSLVDIAKFLSDLMKNDTKRREMVRIGKRYVDDRGSERIVKAMQSEDLLLRKASIEDCELLWKWANDYSVRAVSFSKAFITWEEHIHWFQERINRPFLYIALNQDDLPVGQVRFDQKEAETVISVMIDSDFRNRGYGVALIIKACEEMFLNSDEMAIHAYVKPDNEMSRMAFIRAGFKKMPETAYQGYQAYHFILSRC